MSDRKVFLLCCVYSIIILIADLLIPLGVAAGVLYLIVILQAFSAKQRKFPLYFSLLCSILTFVGLLFSPEGGEFWKVISNRTIALFVIWTTTLLGLQRREVLEQREKALTEIKILRGYLPICASCKNIRDDNGYWNQVEAYIRDHSDVEFSHSICPECAKKLYPGLDLTL